MMAAETALWTLRAAVGLAAGAAVGSFAATAGLRLAQGRNPFTGRSQCDGCARVLGWFESVPVIGYAVAGGHCRTCGGAIAAFHLAGEVAGAAALALPLLLVPGWAGMVTGLLCLLLLTAALIDARTLRLPDGLTAAIAVCAVVLAWRSQHLAAGTIAAILAAAALLGVKWWLEHRSGKAMLGLGDIKLVAALALWLGVRTPAMLALAALFGLVVIRRYKGPMPFGPMIAASAFVVGVLVPESWLA